MLKYKNKNYVCHLDLAMNLIRGKWKTVILCHLEDGPKRFLELQRITCGVSQKVLNENLQELEQDGLITKVTYPVVPPKVEFSLTEMGRDLAPIINSLEKWAVKHFPES